MSRPRWTTRTSRNLGRPLLAVTGVRRAFGGVQALAGVSLEVSPATVHALIGPNGSGKTTLLNVV